MPQNQIVLDDIDLGRECNLLLRQIPRETLEEIEKHLDFVKEIDFSLPQNQIVLDDIDLGRECNLLLRQIPQETLEEIENMKNFRITCLKF